MLLTSEVLEKEVERLTKTLDAVRTLQAAIDFDNGSKPLKRTTKKKNEYSPSNKRPGEKNPIMGSIRSFLGKQTVPQGNGEIVKGICIKGVPKDIACNRVGASLSYMHKRGEVKRKKIDGRFKYTLNK